MQPRCLMLCHTKISIDRRVADRRQHLGTIIIMNLLLFGQLISDLLYVSSYRQFPIRCRGGSAESFGGRGSPIHHHQGSMHRSLDIDRGRGGGGGNGGVCAVARRHSSTLFAFVALALVVATLITRHDGGSSAEGLGGMGIRFNADNPLGKRDFYIDCGLFTCLDR